MNSFPTSPQYQYDSNNVYTDAPFRSSCDDFIPQSPYFQQSMLQKDNSIGQQTMNVKQQSESTKTLYCPECGSEMSPQFINFSECVFLCTNYQRQSAVSNPSQQQLSRGSDQSKAIFDNKPTTCQGPSLRQTSTIKNEHSQTPAISVFEPCCQTGHSKAPCTSGADQLAPNFQQRGMYHKNAATPAAPSHVRLSSDTNYPPLQISQPTPAKTTKCLFPLEMKAPWDNLSISDFICSEDQIDETVKLLKLKFTAIAQGTYISKPSAETLKLYHQSQSFNDESFFKQEYLLEQKLYSHRQLNHAESQKPQTTQDLSTCLPIYNSQSFQANQSTNSSLGVFS